METYCDFFVSALGLITWSAILLSWCITSCFCVGGMKLDGDRYRIRYDPIGFTSGEELVSVFFL